MVDSTIRQAKQASSIAEEVKIDNFREATTTGTDDSSAASTPTNSKFVCYLTTRSGKLGQFELKVNGSEIFIISNQKQKVKTKIAIANLHAKEVPKQPRDSNTFDDDTEIKSPKKANRQ